MHNFTKIISPTGSLNITMSSLNSNGLKSPDLNQEESLWDAVEQEIQIIDLQQLHDVSMSKSLRNVFNTLFKVCNKPN